MTPDTLASDRAQQPAQVVAGRAQHRMQRTNKAFADWHEVFPNAACVVSLIDRLVHHAEVIALEGESYRLKEAKERAARQQRRRSTRKR